MPRRYTTGALVVRTVPFAESSEIVHLATADHGLVHALAKGAYRPGPEFQGGIPLAVLGEAKLLQRRGAELELLRAFRLTDGLRGLRRDLRRFYAGSYVIDLVRTWMRPALPLPALYRATVTALRGMAETTPASIPSWIVWFEARAVAAVGLRPQLEVCAQCGRAVSERAVFSPSAGGIAHRACAPPGELRPLSGADHAALARLYTARLSELSGEPLTEREVRYARAAHDLWIPHVLERRPASLHAAVTGS